MKIEVTANTLRYQISHYDENGIVVNGRRLDESFILTPEDLIVPGLVKSILQLEEADLQPLIDLSPEVLIFGSGNAHHFLTPELSQFLLTQQIGYETMTTPAACRAYNVLLAEGRKVVASMYLEPTTL